MASAWSEKYRNGYRGRYRDQYDTKQSVKDDRGRIIVYRRKSDAEWAANEEMVKAHRKAQTSSKTVRGNITYGELWEMSDVTSRSPASKSDANARSHGNAHILPEWKDVPINEIDENKQKQWINKLKKKKLSISYIRRLYTTFRYPLRWAVEAVEILNEEPPRIKLPMVPRTRQPYTTDAILEEYKGSIRDDYYEVLELLHETGLRPGELCGLHIPNAEEAFQTGWLLITDVYVDKVNIIRSHPKDKDARMVPLTSHAKSLLAKNVAQRDRTRGCGLPHYDANGNVFECPSEIVMRTSVGNPMRPSQISEQLVNAHKRGKTQNRRSAYAARRGWVVWSSKHISVMDQLAIMGHADLKTLMLYHQIDPSVRTALDQARSRGAESGADGE